MSEQLNEAALRMLHFGTKQMCDLDDGLRYIEESLTPEQAREAQLFHEWCKGTGTTYGWNIAEVYQKYRDQCWSEPVDKYPHFVEIKWGHGLPDDEKPTESYRFETKAELDAFMNGVVEAEGWMGYEITKDSRDD